MTSEVIQGNEKSQFENFTDAASFMQAIVTDFFDTERKVVQSETNNRSEK